MSNSQCVCHLRLLFVCCSVCVLSDLSGNYLTIDATLYDDVGAFLFSVMPLPVQTVHLEYNSFAGNWGPGFLTSYPSLSHFFMSNNDLNSIPNDLFEIGGSDTLIDLDLR